MILRLPAGEQRENREAPLTQRPRCPRARRAARSPTDGVHRALHQHGANGNPKRRASFHRHSTERSPRGRLLQRKVPPATRLRAGDTSRGLGTRSQCARLCWALTKWCINPFPLCEVITRKSGLRLLVASCVLCEGGGGDLAGMILPKLLPLDTGRSPGEALALT